MDRSTMVEIIKLTHSTDGGLNSAYERLNEIREIVEAEIRKCGGTFDEDPALD